MTINPYKVLGVKKNATQDEIKAAYLKLAKTLHPDAGGGTDEFVQLGQAYEILNDAKARTAYDNTGYVKGDKESEIRFMAFDNLCRVWDEMMGQIPEEKLPFVNVVRMIRDTVTATLERFKGEIKRVDRSCKKIEKSREIIAKRLSKKKKQASPNLFFLVMDKKLEGLKAERAVLETQREVAEEALKMIDEYEFAPDKEETAESLGKKSAYHEGGVVGGLPPSGRFFIFS